MALKSHSFYEKLIFYWS